MCHGGRRRQVIDHFVIVGIADGPTRTAPRAAPSPIFQASRPNGEHPSGDETRYQNLCPTID
jgi:hypothetical protein